jgi:hypothetical protein
MERYAAASGADLASLVLCRMFDFAIAAPVAFADDLQPPPGTPIRDNKASAVVAELLNAERRSLQSVSSGRRRRLRPRAARQAASNVAPPMSRAMLLRQVEIES